MATWREKFQKEIFPHTKDTIEDLVFESKKPSTLLDREFDDGFGGAEGTPFIAWSENFVYFSRDYDGADYIEYAPRNPPKEMK